MRLIIHAVNVHQGGGAVLLNSLLTAILKDNITCIAFLDKRFKIAKLTSDKVSVTRIKRNIVSRLHAELNLKRIVKEGDVVLCFGNLPPIFKLNSVAILFIQNRYLIDKINLEHFNIKTRLRITLERIWLKLFCKNIDTIIVQTLSMQNCISKNLNRVSVILPYMDTVNAFSRSHIETIFNDSKYDFLYVASGEPHKNHKKLVEAWVILAAEGIFPVLCLTLNEKNNHQLVVWIRDLVLKYDLQIVNVGFVLQPAIAELYKQTNALIYPSTLESFGLPLIEARCAKLAIVASELDYVRDILDPEETFDPSSSKSIARAVKRYLGYEEKDLPLVDTNSFLKFCLNQINLGE